MTVWVCASCDHEYDSQDGDLRHGISPGTSMDELPEDWVCPECGAPKIEFAPYPATGPQDGSGWTTSNS